MFLSKVFIAVTLLFTLNLNFLPLHAERIPIESIDEVVTHVRTLRETGVKAEDIGVILDCHGVVTKETQHATPHTLKDNILEALNYFKEEGISVVIATAWDNLDDVVQNAIVELGLGHFFDVTSHQKSELEDFSAGCEGAVKLRGYKNGRVVALKSVTNFDTIRYFRMKAFALEIAYPGRVFSHICGVDDDICNLSIIEKTFSHTRHSSEGCSLTLFHLTTPAVVDLLPVLSGFGLSPSTSQHPSTQVPSSHPHPDLPPTVTTQHSDHESSSTDYEREQFYDGYGSNDE
ncbi:MAG: HAD family hydrolase [Alphaproteobacteria bacterium]|nr:HAD family hydrolase [Alphaproteobacteria bacterium]